MTTAAGMSPSYPYMTDEYEPTNANLWERVLEVARGDRRELTINDRTIHAPNQGMGFRHWPNSKGVAWAVKQYKGFNGGWKRKEASGFGLLARTRAGVLVTKVGSAEHRLAEDLRGHGLVRLVEQAPEWGYWVATFQGARLVRASLGDGKDLIVNGTYILRSP